MHAKKISITLVTMAFLALFAILPLDARAAPLSQNKATAVMAEPVQIEPESLEAFLDKFFQEQMQDLNIPGAVVVFVQDGKIIFQQGYGLANVVDTTPVDPEETIFRAGSISKLFVTTAVLQLVEQGRIQLDAPISEYLPDIRIQNPFDTPVRVKHLLTHTAGFDEKMVGMGTNNLQDLQPLGQYLAENMPPVVMEPGDQISYSNHGFALAGLLVERVSGMPFADYIRNHIFDPLGMADSSFEEHPAQHILDRLASGYAFTNGEYHPLPLDYLNVGPAGSLFTTAPDMARFMIAQLNQGKGTTGRILSNEMTAVMQAQQFSHHPELAGWAYGFYEQFENGRRALVHGGDLPGYSSLMYLLPEENAGFFVGVNTALNPIFSNDLRETLVEDILDRLFPGQNSLPESSKAVLDLAQFEGNYRWNRYVRTTAFKGLPPSPLLQFKIRVTENGTLQMTPPMGIGDVTYWEPLGGPVFKEQGGENLMAFRQDDGGRITHQFLSHFGNPIAAERVSWYETDTFQIGLLAAIVFLYLTTLAWPIAGIVRRLFKRKSAISASIQRSRRWAGAAALLFAIFLLGLAGITGQVSLAPFSPVPSTFYGLLAIPLLTLVIAFFLTRASISAWRSQAGTLLSRVHVTLVLLAAASFVWFAAHWNLLGWQF